MAPVLVQIGDFSLHSFGVLILIGYGSSLAVFLFFLLRRPQPMNVWRLLDLFAVAGVTAFAFQRLGCFFAGCHFGALCELPWCVEFPIGSMPHQAQVMAGWVGIDTPALPVHPVQLYRAVGFGVLGAGGIAWLHIGARLRGQVGLVLVPIALLLSWGVGWLDAGPELEQPGASWLSLVSVILVVPAAVVAHVLLSRGSRE